MCVSPTGFGKTILAQQLVEGAISADNDTTADATNKAVFNKVLSLSPDDHAAVSAAVSNMTDRTRSLIVIDDATTDCLALLDQIDIPANNSVVVFSRHEPPPAMLQRQRTTYLGVPELRFSYPELVQLCGEAVNQEKAEPLALVLDSMTAGWPEHVVRVLSAMSLHGYEPESAHLLIYDGHHLDDLINRCMDSLSPTFQEGLEQLSHLPSFSAGAANAFVPGLAAEATRSGFPLYRGRGGALEMPMLLREHLKRRSTLTDESATILAPLLVATLGVPDALGSLLSAGATAQAAAIVCQMSPNQLAASNQANMLGIFRAIERTEPDNPSVVLRRAIVHRNMAQLKAEREAVESALDIARRIGDTDEELAAEVALLRIDLRHIDQAQAEAWLTRLEESSNTSSSSPVGIGLRELRAMVLEQKADLQSIYRSIELLAELASEWEHIGDRARSAQLLRMMAAGPLNTIGDYQEARITLDRAAKLVWDNPMGMAVTSQLLCRFLALVGDSDRFETELARASGLIDAVDLRWMSGYLDWAVVHCSLLKNDRQAAERAHKRAIDRLGELSNDDTGVIFFAESAAVLAVLGSDDLARDCLDRSLRQSSPNHIEVAVASIVVEARIGDAKLVEAKAAELKATGNLAHERLWRVELEQLVALQRMGMGDADFSSAVAELRSNSEELGLARLVEALLPQVPTQEPVHGAPPQTSTDTQIELLGEFRVRVNGEVLELAPGHVTTLLKLLAVRGEPMAVEVVVSNLWPDADIGVGKRRLKNVVSRLRHAVENPIIERLGERISLADNVGTDLAAFRSAANAAVRPNDGRGLGACIEALNLYTGHLLPTDLYDDEITRERDALRAVALSVLEMTLEHAAGGGVSPAWLLQTAMRLEPDSEVPFLKIEAIADSAGSTECAAAAHSQALALAEDLGIFLDPRPV